MSSFRPPTSSFRRRPESRRGGVGQDRHTIGTSPAPHHFHPRTQPSEGLGDFLEAFPRANTGIGNPGEGRPAHPCHVESLWAVPPQPRVLVRSQFAQAQDELLSNLNSYPELEGSRFVQIVDGTVCRYHRAGDCAVALPFAMMPTPTIRAKR